MIEQRHVHLVGQLVHQVILYGRARMGEEGHHDGRGHRRADGAHERQGGERRVRLGFPRLGQHHVVERRSHGESHAQADEHEAHHHVRHRGDGRGRKRQVQRAGHRGREAEPENHLHAEPVDELARHRRAHAGEQREDDDEVAARAGGHAQCVLRELRDEDHAHHHHARDDGEQKRDDDVRVLEVRQVHDGIGCAPLHEHEQGQQHDERDEKRVDVGRGDGVREVEEVEVAQAVQQAQHHHDEHADAPAVDGAHVGLLGVLEHERAGREDEQADGDVHVEDELPVLLSEHVEDQAAGRGAEHVRDAVHAAHEAECHAAFLLGERRAELRGCHGHDAAASHGLYRARHEQHLEAAEVLREAAEQRAHTEEPDAGEVDGLAAVAVGQFAHHRDGGGVGERIDGDHPYAELLVDMQAALDNGAGRRDDARVERPDEEPEKVHDGYDDVALAARTRHA